MNIERNVIHLGDCLTGMQKLPNECIDCCVTSPPYWGLRDYGVDGQLGLEETPEQFIKKMVAVFSEVKRVLKPTGTLWVNIGDSYAATGKSRSDEQACRKSTLAGGKGNNIACKDQPNKIVSGLKPKDLVGVPWMLAFALRTDGWYLRQDIIWSKNSVMPESVKDRCTKSHEYIFLLSKNQKYYYNQDSIKEVASNNTHARQSRAKAGHKSHPNDKSNGIRPPKAQGIPTGIIKNNESFNLALSKVVDMRNKRSVWVVNPEALSEAHFATFPQKLIEPCIKAGCPEDGIVLDPFMGAGTTGLVARKLNRNFIGFELNPEYITIAEKRLSNELGLFE